MIGGKGWQEGGWGEGIGGGWGGGGRGWQEKGGGGDGSPFVSLLVIIFQRFLPFLQWLLCKIEEGGREGGRVRVGCVTDEMDEMESM